MRYLDILGFRKHLRSSFPNNLSTSYLVINSHQYERKKLFEEILCYLPHESNYAVSRFFGGQDSVHKVIESLRSPFLLGGESILVIDDVDLFKPKDIGILLASLAGLSSYVIMGASNKKVISSLYAAIEKRGLVLDLFYEKPWDREKRFLDFIAASVVRHKKTMPLQLQKIFLQRVGQDLAYVERELGKLLTYVGNRSDITQEDIEQVTIACEAHTFWQIADTILWKEDPWVSYFIPAKDLSFFHSLVPALRFQLELGYKISSLTEKGYNIEDFSSDFPRMPPKIFAQKKALAMKRSSAFYKNMLLTLFRLDLLSKRGINLPSVLIHLFQAKVAYVLQRINSSS